jgi:hypothetical protein
LDIDGHGEQSSEWLRVSLIRDRLFRARRQLGGICGEVRHGHSMAQGDGPHQGLNARG